MSFLIILGLFLWVMFAFWPAFIAKQKGYSFILFLVLSWLVSFILTLLFAALLPDKTKTEEQKEADRAAEAAIERNESRV